MRAIGVGRESSSKRYHIESGGPAGNYPHTHMMTPILHKSVPEDVDELRSIVELFRGWRARGEKNVIRIGCDQSRA